MELFDCPTCGRGGWTTYEIENGLCPCCQQEEFEKEEEWEEMQPYSDCPKCGRTYDHIGFDLQYCKACGWDAENKKWDKPIEPTDDDFMAGEADILTGRWY